MASSSTDSPPEIVTENRNARIAHPVRSESESDVNNDHTNVRENDAGQTVVVEKGESESEGDAVREEDDTGEMKTEIEKDRKDSAKKRKIDESDSLEEESEEEEEEFTAEKQTSHASNGMIEFPIEPMKSHLICMCCKGYFREPYTIAECLHTFCKSCLFLKFHSGFRRCPTCNISLEPDPYIAALHDRTLQEILDKIFPQLKEIDDEKERKFYKKREIELKETTPLEDSTGPASPIRQSNRSYTNATSNSLAYSYHDSLPQCRGIDEDDGLEPLPLKAVVFTLKPDDEVTNPMDPLQNPILRTSGQLKVRQIKKYIIQKLNLNTSSSTIEVLCDGDPLGEELSLKFIRRTRWHHPTQDLCLNYRIGEDEAY